MKKKLLYLLFILMTLLLIINPQNSVIYASNALSLCTEVIIPSLFPFFVCSGLLICSGFCDVPARLLKPVMKPLFNVNGAGATAFVLGIISGYPLGAQVACRLYEESYISKTEAERLLAFCNNSGPLFILGAVGASLYHNPKIGLCLYVAHLISALIVGIIFRFYKKNDFIAPNSQINVEEKSLPEIFSYALASSTQSILTVCGAVVFFSVVSGIFTSYLPFSENIKSAVIGLLEFTTGINSISKSSLPLLEKLVLSAGIVGFAGLSVHIQVLSIVAKYRLSMIPYILGKLLQAVFSMAFALLFLKLIPQEISVFSPNTIEISGAFAMNSLFVIITAFSAFFIALGGGIYLFFLKRKNIC